MIEGRKRSSLTLGAEPLSLQLITPPDKSKVLSIPTRVGLMKSSRARIPSRGLEHGDLAGPHNGLFAGAGDNLLLAEAEMVAHQRFNGLDGDLLSLPGHIRHDALGQGKIGWNAHK